MSDYYVVDVTRLIILQANRGVEAHNFGFWDAQIWATAKLNQISEVYIEDFNSAAKYSQDLRKIENVILLA